MNKNTSHVLTALLNGCTTSAEVAKFLGDTEIRTIQRALERLLRLNIVSQSGPTNAPKYDVLYGNLTHYDVAEKFLLVDDRPETSLNYAYIEWLETKTAHELDALFGYDSTTHKKQSLSPRDLEYLTVELSWKSSSLEGNTYTLLDTQLLLTEGIKPKNRTEFETQMILNHKNALAFIVENPEEFSGTIRFAAVEELHRIIGDNLGIDNGVRKKVVKISASNYIPPAGPQHLRKLADRILSIISRPHSPETRALLALGLVPYLQIFEDGNKRTGRMLSNAILISTLGCGYSLRKVEARTLALAYLRLYEFNSFKSLRTIFDKELQQTASR